MNENNYIFLIFLDKLLHVLKCSTNLKNYSYGLEISIWYRAEIELEDNPKKNIFGPIYNIKKHKNVLFNFDALENLEDLK